MYLRKNKTFILFINLLLISFFLFFWHGAKANIIVVDDPTGDDIDNGLCSITEAFLNSGFGDQSGSPDCVSGSPAGNIISIETDIVLDTVFDTLGDPFGLPDPGEAVINGNGHTISRDLGAPEFRIFTFAGGVDIEINDLTITGGNTTSTTGQGGAIKTTSLNSLTLNNVTLDGNSAVNGGAIYVLFGLAPVDIIINDSIFLNNSSTGDGGSIFTDNNINFGGSLVINNSTFNTNQSGGNGGAINTDVEEIEVSESFFTENVTAGGPLSGGVFYVDGQTNFNVTDSYFYFNRPSTAYGGIFNVREDVVLEVSNSTFENNVAGSGGVFYLYNGAELTVYNSTFDTNVAIDSGGVIFSYQGLGSEPNKINFYHNAEDGSFAGENSSSFLLNCISNGTFCISNADPGDENPFTEDLYFVENNIFLTDGCDGNIENMSFENNLSSFSTCGVPVGAPINVSEDLAENGGLWKTLKVSLGSNAIDAGVPGELGCPSTDGRGVPRPFGSVCDIGPYEFTGIAEVIITETDGGTSVSEPDTEDEYTIVLGEAPTSSVTIDLEKSSNDFDVSPSSVTFTTLNWFNPRTITVTAEDNSDDDGDRVESITHILDTSDTVYELVLADNVVVNIADDDESGGGGTTTSSSGSSGGQPPRVYGCTDSTALNYNPSANTSDNSCDYFVWIYFGCDDPSATNYDVRVTNNNGTCIYEISRVPGCTNSSALNYNSSATEDDGSCSYAPPTLTPGCMDSLALNFNSSADTDDGSCEYEDTVTPEIPEEIEPVVVPPVVPQPPAPPTTPVIIPETVTALDMAMEVLSGLFKNISEVLGVIVENISENTLQYGAGAGVLAPIIIFLATNPGALVTVPVRIWTAIPTLLGIKRRKRPWGTVYDSVTKQPLDPVYLVLEDEYGNEIATTISDLDGRFGFIASPGRYKIRANKDGYEFPSRKMLGKTKDDLYENLYFSEFVEIQKEDDLLIKNIPMDSINFNWNEFEKSKNRSLMKFFSKTDLFLSGISDIVFVLGALLSLLLVFKSTSTLNLVIVGVYVLIVLLKIFGVSPKKPGHVINKENGNPISFGLVKVFSSNTGVEISHSVISKTGRYYVLVPKGEYFVEISEKIGEDLYRPIYTSGLMKIKNGYLGNVFKV